MRSFLNTYLFGKNGWIRALSHVVFSRVKVGYIKTVLISVALVLYAGMAVTADPVTVKDNFNQYCASCHGVNMTGGLAGSLLDEQWLVNGSSEALRKIIAEGDAERGMPPWSESLTEQEIRSLVIYIQETRYKFKHQSPTNLVKEKAITALGHSFSIDTIYTAENILWALEYLPDGTMLVTQRDGELHRISPKGELIAKVEGLPNIWHHVQGGLMDITLHPEYQKNGWIYISYAASKDGVKGNVDVARGKLRNNKWVDHQIIFSSSEDTYTESGRHFGSRIVLQDGYVYFAIGERGDRPSAQDMSVPNGKLFRLHDDGRVPEDNPFVNRKGALAGIWSLGHRNPQGMAIEPNSQHIWAAEHGPRGGDELNLIAKGANYGWPIITYGMNYDGTPITHLTEQDPLVQPKHYWVPSIAPSGIAFYDGDMFKSWQGKLLVGGLAIQELQMLTTQGDAIIKSEVILSDRGRIRDVSVAADGSVFLIVTIEGKGQILKLTAKQ